MTNSTTTSERPVSPHIGIYRWPVTMAISIVHRISGGALYFGTVLLVVWLTGVACGEEAFNTVHAVYASFIGRIILFLYTLALVHHLVGGVRHLFWDACPALLEKRCATKAARVTIFVSVILTLLVWIAGYAAL